MAFTIDPGTPLDAEIRRLAGAQLLRIEKVLGGLRDDDRPAANSATPAAEGADGSVADERRQAAVFEARKRLKKLRGLIRLVRDVAPRFYADHNARYRDAAAGLSKVRDRSAVVDALDRLVTHHAGRIEPGAFARTRTILMRNNTLKRNPAASPASTAEEPDDAVMAAIDVALRDVGEARHRMDGFVIKRSKKPAKILAKGFSRNYGKAKRQLDALERGSDAEAFHTLRKLVKYHRFHLRLLGSAWPELFAPMVASARSVVDDLGHDHDYEVLRESVLAMPGEGGDALPASEVSLLFALLDQRQEELRTSALAGARRLLVVEPKAVQRWICRQLELAAETVPDAAISGVPSAKTDGN